MSVIDSGNEAGDGKDLVYVRLDTRYRLLGPGPVGFGANSNVWKAEAVFEGAERSFFAIKILKGMSIGDQKWRREYHREVKHAERLGAHPYITRVIEHGIDPDKGAWIAMEFACGNLKDDISDQPAASDLVQSAMWDVLSALRIVHGQGIVHNDIKPTNILKSEHGSYKLADFGISTVLGATQSLTTNPAMTVAYASPESYSIPTRTDQRSDLYLLGFTLYELAVGRDRFRATFPSVLPQRAGDNFVQNVDVAWKQWHLSDDELPTISTLPPKLARMISRLARKNPLDRYQSADEAIAELVRCHTGEDAHSNSLGEHNERIPALVDRFVYASVFIVVVLVGLLAACVSQLIRMNRLMNEKATMSVVERALDRRALVSDVRAVEGQVSGLASRIDGDTERRLDDLEKENNRINSSIRVYGEFLDSAKRVIPEIKTGLAELRESARDGEARSARTADVLSSVEKQLGTLAALPTGAVLPFAGCLDPACRVELQELGWLICDGAEYDSNANGLLSGLRDLLGSAYATGRKGVFRVPDYRGLFLRGLDDSGRVDLEQGSRTMPFDPGKKFAGVGSIQSFRTALPRSSFELGVSGGHSHKLKLPTAHGGHPGNCFGFAGTDAWSENSGNRWFFDPDTGTAGSHTHTISGGDKETVPANAYVMFMIRI